ncbi:MAG TPA: homoserine kinase, partial [Dehalococcoidia bacterium]
LQVVVRRADGFAHLRTPIAEGLRVVLFVPDFEMPTAESRKLLPQTLTREEAVHNIGRAALLVAALAGGAWDVLDEATQDTLHQPARTKIFPAMSEIFAAAKEAGALCAYLSGAGSTIAAFTVANADSVGDAMRAQAAMHGHTGRVEITTPSDEGTRVISER